jgi:hypothetical protein
MANEAGYMRLPSLSAGRTQGSAKPVVLVLLVGQLLVFEQIVGPLLSVH